MPKSGLANRLFRKDVNSLSHLLTPGPRGEKGASGSDGVDGLDGLDGRDGENGKDGLDGLQGPEGSPGDRGFPGPKGDKGDPGPIGPEGIEGPPGPKGDTPAHQTSKGELRFENPDGTWGKWINVGTTVYRGGGGSTTESSGGSADYPPGGATGQVLAKASPADNDVEWATVSGASEVNDLTATVTWANVPDANITSSSVTQHESSIDHDNLANFVANEHIDWSVTGAEDVNVDRIAAGAITQHEAALSVTESQISDLGSYLADAPSDGSTYARLNGAWSVITSGGLGNVSEDTTPQLGGNLDANGFTIQNVAADITLDNGVGLVSDAGGELVTGPGGASWQAIPGSSTATAFVINTNASVPLIFAGAGLTSPTWVTDFYADDGTTLIMRVDHDNQQVMLLEMSSAVTPPTNFGAFYPKTDGLPYFKNDSGTELGLTKDLGEFTVAGLPSASTNADSWALATDASGGRTIVRSDGTNWKVVVVEGATVST